MLNIFFVCSFVSCLALLTAGGQGTLASGGGVRNIVQKNNKVWSRCRNSHHIGDFYTMQV